MSHRVNLPALVTVLAVVLAGIATLVLADANSSIAAAVIIVLVVIAGAGVGAGVAIPRHHRP